MVWQGWLSLAVTAAVFIGLQLGRRVPADVVFLSGLAVLTLSGILTPNQALAGFANPAVMMIGAMFVVAAAMRNTGVLDWLGNKLLGSARSERSVLLRLAGALMPTSAFMPNTPLVAMTMPVAIDWCRRNKMSPSKLLMAVSYFSILGGCCSLIGTSTNLVIHGMLRQEHDSNRWLHEPAFRAQVREMGLFEIGAAGLPCAAVGVVAFMLLGRRLIPDRQDIVEQVGARRRDYLVEMMVRPECRLIGKSVEQAGLRHLEGLFLIEIDRGNEVITPVTPKDVIQAGDRLVFTGVVTMIVDLERIPGLVPAADVAYEFRVGERHERHLTEAVLSRTSPIIGLTVKDANFRQRYGAAVVAVHRNGARVTNKVGSIVLEPGDVLLLQTRTGFVETHRDNRDFYLVSAVEGSTPPRHHRAWLTGGLMLLLVVWMGGTSLLDPELIGHWKLKGLASPDVAAITIACLMIATRCLPVSMARSSLDLEVLITIAASLGVGQAMSESGAARWIAETIVAQLGPNDYLLLTVMVLLTVAFGELMSNNAVAAMMFPLAVQVAHVGNYNPRTFIMGITLAASFSFLTPVGYQTNLMVMGPGGYQPRDFFRAGLPVSLSVTAMALVMIPLVWPFR